jgi:pimeloyl-ACP methyl ester carboxylesterase
MGHSLGCNKAIHYFYKHSPSEINGIILASPPDMVGLAADDDYRVQNYNEVLIEAKKNVKKGKPRKLLSNLIWNWYLLSSQTFLDLSEEDGPADNLPIKRNPEHFRELASINVPILAILGEHDDVVIKSAEEDLELLKSKSEKCLSFTKEIIKGANHNYEGREKELGKKIINWVKSLA